MTCVQHDQVGNLIDRFESRFPLKTKDSQYASKWDHEEIVKMLLGKDNIEINQIDNIGWTALMLASEEGHKEIVKMLLD